MSILTEIVSDSFKKAVEPTKPKRYEGTVVSNYREPSQEHIQRFELWKPKLYWERP